MPALFPVSIKCAICCFGFPLPSNWWNFGGWNPWGIAVHQSFSYKACYNDEFYENLLLDESSLHQLSSFEFAQLILSLRLSCFLICAHHWLLAVIELFVRIFTTRAFVRDFRWPLPQLLFQISDMLVLMLNLSVLLFVFLGESFRSCLFVCQFFPQVHSLCHHD